MAIPTSLLETVRPATLNIVLTQGSDFRLAGQVQIAGVPVDLSSGAAVTAAAKVRATFPAGTLLLTMTATVPTPATGSVLVTASAALTAALARPAGSDSTTREVQIGFWDLELTDGTNTKMVAAGTVTLLCEATS